MSEQHIGEVYQLPLTQLQADEYYQPRRNGLSEAHVRVCLESNPATWPPLLVTPNNQGGFDIIDGFHRYEAARRLGLHALPCRVDPEADYFTAVAANVTHGLPLSLADRKEAAQWLAEQEPGLSLREIGRRVGLSDKTVKRALNENSSAENPRPAPDPVARFVGQVYRLVDDSEIRTATLRREIETYEETWRADIATALDAIGRTCVAAAEPYLGKGN